MQTQTARPLPTPLSPLPASTSLPRVEAYRPSLWFAAAAGLALWARLGSAGYLVLLGLR